MGGCSQYLSQGYWNHLKAWMRLEYLLPSCLAHVPGTLVLVGRKPPFLVMWTCPRDAWVASLAWPLWPSGQCAIQQSQVEAGKFFRTAFRKLHCRLFPHCLVGSRSVFLTVGSDYTGCKIRRQVHFLSRGPTMGHHGGWLTQRSFCDSQRHTSAAGGMPGRAARLEDGLSSFCHVNWTAVLLLFDPGLQSSSWNRPQCVE